MLEERVDICNIYAPYDSQNTFSDRMEASNIMQIGSVIFGGDFNANLNYEEVWGKNGHDDPMVAKVNCLFEENHLVDI